MAKKRRKFNLIFLTLLCFSFFGCEKKYLDIVPVIQVEANISIQNGGDIEHFSFPGGGVGYAAADTNFYYKTQDNGATWIQVNPSLGNNIRGLEFFTPEEGICLIDGTVFSTEDGGDTWNMEISGILGIGVSENGIAVACNPGISDVAVYQSTDNGSTWTSAGVVSKEVTADVTRMCVSGSRAYILTDQDGLEGLVRAWDLSANGQTAVYLEGLTAYDELNGIYTDGLRTVAVGNRGNIFEGQSSTLRRSHYGHMRTFISVDGMNGVLVAIGESTISSDQELADTDEKWNEVLTEEGSSFSSTYYKIKFYNTREFFLSGKNGLLLKCKLP